MIKKKILFSIFIMSFLLLSTPQKTSGFFGQTIAEFKHFIDDPESPEMFILDVREKAKYIDGHIPGAVSIYYKEIANNKDKLPIDRTIAILVYGEQDDAGDAIIAAQEIEKIEPGFIMVMNGSFDDWPYEKVQGHYPYGTEVPTESNTGNSSPSNPQNDILNNPIVWVVSVAFIVSIPLLFVYRGRSRRITFTEIDSATEYSKRQKQLDDIQEKIEEKTRKKTQVKKLEKKEKVLRRRK